MVIAASRFEDAGESLSAAYGVLARVEESDCPAVALHLAVMLSNARPDARERAEFVLTAERFRELVDAGALGDGW